MDARTGDVLLDGPLYSQDRFSFMGIMLSLHVDLFASLPGELFLGFMGLLFCVAIVSGVVLYGPFMKKLEFGTVRASRSTRLKWLDLHNLLGIVTLVWAFVVGRRAWSTSCPRRCSACGSPPSWSASWSPQGPGHSRRAGLGAGGGGYRAPGHARHRDFLHRLSRQRLRQPSPLRCGCAATPRSPRA